LQSPTEATEGLLRHFVPRNDRKVALLLDLLLRAERSNLLFDNAPFLLEYEKRLYMVYCLEKLRKLQYVLLH